MSSIKSGKMFNLHSLFPFLFGSDIFRLYSFILPHADAIQATMEREPNKRLGAHHTAQVKAFPLRIFFPFVLCVFAVLIENQGLSSSLTTNDLNHAKPKIGHVL